MRANAHDAVLPDDARECSSANTLRVQTEVSVVWVTASLTCIFVSLADVYATVFVRPFLGMFEKAPIALLVLACSVVGRVALRLGCDSTHTGGSPRMSGVYWRLVSPMIHSPRGRIVVVALLTGLLVFAPAYAPDGSLTFNIVP